MHKLESDLNQLYADFFKKCEIDEETGIVKSNPYKRFATKVAIGENYLNSEKKILFVSLDMGRDENLVDFNKNTFQDFQQRRDSVCSGGNLGDKNPHMAGVYGTALYFLKDHYNWEVSWKLLVEKNQFFREILIANNGILPQNVLKHIALLNFYNFVTVGRKDRTGGSDRKLVFEKDEINLLIQTINTLKIRGSYGSLGDQVADFGGNWYPFYPSLGPTPATNTNWYFSSGREAGTFAPGLVDPTVTWVTTTTLDFGLDLTALRNRFGLTFDWYKRSADDFLGSKGNYPAILGIILILLHF